MSAKESVKLNRSLCNRARAVVDKAGYSSLEEFIEHSVEKSLRHLEEADSKEELLKKLKGLGYLA
jgi:hypothetical protein